MAAVSTATLTPPSSSHGRSAVVGDWDFSVPIDGADTPDHTFRGSSTSSSMPHRTGFDDHSQNGRPTNDFGHVQQAKAPSPADVHSPPAIVSQNHVNDYRYMQQPPSQSEGYHRSATPDLLTAPKAPLLKRQGSTVSSNHDGDSVFDLYGGGRRMSTVSAASLGLFVPHGGAEVFPSFVNGNNQGNMGSEEPDSSKWIHRDKLEENYLDSSKRFHRDKLGEGELESLKWINRDTLDKGDPDSSKWIHRDKLAKIEAGDAGGRAVYDAKVDPGTSRWIDRDKLAKIENQELQRAGIAVSRSRASSNTTHQGNENENSRDQKKQQVVSPLPIEGGDEHIFNNPNEFSNDLRTPEEQAADRTAHRNMPPHRQFSRNTSYSRIPVPTSSPFPIPQQFLERSAPLLRNPTTPHGSDDDRASLTNTFIRSRKRSHSAGSAFLLDDPASALPPPGVTSNPKNASRNPTTPGSSPRKPRPSNSLKQRTRSNPQLYHRPGTSASHATHLGNAGAAESTKKHPDGPPPWTLQSHKPDPTLPPDQQIIPTVAKRMQQEQWERDGAPADVYDRDLRPLRVHGDDEVERARHRRTISQEDQRDNKPEEWPLKSPTVPVDEPKEARQDAGYKAMPNVNGNAQAGALQAQPPGQQSPTDVEREKEERKKRKKEKSLCCCVIC